MRANTLRGKITEHGMTIGRFCEITGFVRSTFDRKMCGESEFTVGEMKRIQAELGLTAEETCNIFFADEVT